MSETKEIFGVGFRREHYNWVTTQRPAQIDVFEIVSENFMGVGGRPKFYLEKLCENYPVFMHGVSLSIGTKGSFDTRYLRKLKELATIVQPKMISDHLSWSRLGTRNSHDLLPIAYTQESMNELIGKIGFLQDFLGQRFYFENPSAYVAFAAADYDEAGFFAELLRRTGAGILLDLNNLYVNYKNLGQDPYEYLKALHPSQVGYFHLAGHNDEGEVIIDTHDKPVPDSVWSIYAKAREIFPNTPAVVEWDGNVPDFSVLLAESEKARSFAKGVDTQAFATVAPRAERFEFRTQKNVDRYTQLFQQIIKPFGIDSEDTEVLRNDLPISAPLGLRVYNHAYFLRLEEAMKDTFPGLAFVCEEEGFRYLLAAYLEKYPPVGSDLNAVSRFLPTFLRETENLGFDFGVPLALLGDLGGLELARSETVLAEDNKQPLSGEALNAFTPADWETVVFKTAETIRLVSCTYLVLSTLHALDRQDVPSPPDEGDAYYMVYREGHTVQEVTLTVRDAHLLSQLIKGTNFMDACAAVGDKAPGYIETATVTYAAGKILEWSQMGLLHRQTNDASRVDLKNTFCA